MAIELSKEEKLLAIQGLQRELSGEAGPVTAVSTLRRGERFIGVLPNGVVEVEDIYARDKIDVSQATIMRAKQAEIMVLLTPEERNAAFCALSPYLEVFSKRQASYYDLEELYILGQARLPGKPEGDDGGEVVMWYRCFENARAVRERGAIAKRLITEAVCEQAVRTPSVPVEITSIASGSARCVLEIMRQMRDQGVGMKARMLDRDVEALAYSKRLAVEMDLIEEDEEAKDEEDRTIEFITGNVVRLNGPVTRRPSHIVEAVGIMDYLDERICRGIFLPTVYRLLAPGGVLVASNIVHNGEEDFLHTAVKWQPMQYRDSGEFSGLFLDPNVGFDPKRCKLHRNPNGIYRVIETEKAI